MAKRTRLDVEYENGHRSFVNAPQTGIYDAITPWLAAGRPIDNLVGAPIPGNTPTMVPTTQPTNA